MPTNVYSSKVTCAFPAPVPPVPVWQIAIAGNCPTDLCILSPYNGGGQCLLGKVTLVLCFCTSFDSGTSFVSPSLSLFHTQSGSSALQEEPSDVSSFTCSHPHANLLSPSLTPTQGCPGCPCSPWGTTTWPGCRRPSSPPSPPWPGCE